MREVIHLAGPVLFLVSTALSFAFVSLYFLRSNWRATGTGRALMGYMSVVLAIMLSSAIFSFFWPDSILWREVVRAILYSLLAIVLMRLLCILLRVQKHERRENVR